MTIDVDDERVPFSGIASRRVAACRASETEWKNLSRCDDFAELYARGQQAAGSWVETVMIAEEQERLSRDLLLDIDAQARELNVDPAELQSLRVKAVRLRDTGWLPARALAEDIDKIASKVDRRP